MPVEIPKDSWSGAVGTVTLGATAAEGGTRARTVTVGGQKTMPTAAAMPPKRAGVAMISAWNTCRRTRSPVVQPMDLSSA